MLLTLSATRLRNAARAAIRSGDYSRARDLVELAQSRSPATQGRELLLLARWLESLHRRT